MFTTTRLLTELPLPLRQSTEQTQPIPAALHIESSQVNGIELLDSLPQSGLAIVGTRHPTHRTQAALKRWILELQDTGLVILSGLALGIDSLAHQCAIEAGLKTIGILGHGLSHQYPPQNVSLRKRILDSGGLIVSEFPPEQPAKPWQFLQRNRLIAAWSKAVVIAEAPQSSGSLNTASWARELGRDLYAVPAWPSESAFAGNIQLLDRDHALPFWGIHSLGATWLPLSTHLARRDHQALAPLVALAKKLLIQSEAIDPIQLIQEATRLGWTEEQAFCQLQNHIKNNEFIESRGLILINPSPSR